MRFGESIDAYVADMRAAGRINSDATERGYRLALGVLSDTVANRDPRTIGRDQIKTALATWTHPNTQANRRAIFIAYFDWTMEEGIRDTNPARQTRRPKRRPARVYRMTLDETARLLAAAHTPRERRTIYLGVCAGARLQELRGFQGRHFDRPGWIWISADIAKGGRERWIPILPELEPVAHDIRATVAATEYVLPAQRWRNGWDTSLGKRDLQLVPCSRQAVRTVVEDVAKRAGITAHIHPHLLRHAFGDHVARYAGIRNAQALLGHATVGTTEAYTGQPTLDELAEAIRGFRFDRTSVRPSALTPETALQAASRLEPVVGASSTVARNLGDALAACREWFRGELAVA